MVISCAVASPAGAAKRGKSQPPANAAKSAETQALDAFQLGVALYRKDDFQNAANMFRTAFSLHARPVYLFNAARSAHRGGALESAAAGYDACARLPGADARIVARSQSFLAEVKLALKQRAALAAEKPTVQVDGSAPVSAGWRPPAAWASVGSGAALVLVGGWLLSAASTAQDELDGRTSQRDATKVVGTDWKTYTADQDSIDLNLGLGIGAAAGGLALAGVGVWLLLSDDPDPAVTPSPTANGRGFQLALRF